MERGYSPVQDMVITLIFPRLFISGHGPWVFHDHYHAAVAPRVAAYMAGVGIGEVLAHPAIFYRVPRFNYYIRKTTGFLHWHV
jgi:hypothetical protein